MGKVTMYCLPYIYLERKATPPICDRLSRYKLANTCFPLGTPANLDYSKYALGGLDSLWNKAVCSERVRERKTILGKSLSTFSPQCAPISEACFPLQPNSSKTHPPPLED